MVSSEAPRGNDKILLRKFCQIILNWKKHGEIAWELKSGAMWRADFDMLWIQLEQRKPEFSNSSHVNEDLFPSMPQIAASEIFARNIVNLFFKDLLHLKIKHAGL